MPLGFCNPPVCWKLTFNFAGAKVHVVDNNFTPPRVRNMNPNLFAAQVAAVRARLNAIANVSCDKDCICMRLHKKAVTVMYDPQPMDPDPAQPGVDFSLRGITATGFFGLCLPKKGSIRIQRPDGSWVYPEDLPSTDILRIPPSSPGGSSGGKKKKGKKGKKSRQGKRRR